MTPLLTCFKNTGIDTEVSKQITWA